MRKLAHAVFVDVSPFGGNPDFQWFFASRAMTSAARQVIIVAVPLQIYALTGSSLAVGLIGAAQLIPLLMVALVGGALADALDRRRLLIVVQLLLAVTCGGLAVYAFSDNAALWPIYLLVAINAGIFAVEQPTRTAVLATIVTYENLPSAMALNQVLNQLSKAVVPALGGFMVALAGTTATYTTAAVLTVAGALTMRGVSPLPPTGGGRSFGWRSIVEGLGYIRRDRLIKATLVVDINAMVFGMPSALFPAIGTEVLGGDATTVGLLYAAPGIGALLAAVTSGWLRRVRRQGLTVIVSVMIWGLAIAAFGFTASLGLALLLLAIAGAADVISAVFRGTIIQMRVPDDLRGRVSSAHSAAVGGGPRLGDLEAGVVASLTSTQVSVVSGGLVCALGTLVIAKTMPELPRFQPPLQPAPVERGPK